MKPLNQELISRILGSTMRPIKRPHFGQMGTHAIEQIRNGPMTHHQADERVKKALGDKCAACLRPPQGGSKYQVRFYEMTKTKPNGECFHSFKTISASDRSWEDALAKAGIPACKEG